MVEKISSIKKRYNQIWGLIKKNIELYFKKGPVIIFGILFPFFLALSWVLGRPIDNIQLFSGFLGMSVFFLGTAISPVIFPWETREKSLERIISAPVSILDLIFSIISSSTLFSIIISTVVCIILIPIFSIPILVFGWFLLGSFLLSWISSSLGLLISAFPSDTVSDIMLITTLVKFPLLFISGIFIPLSLMPQPLFILSLISPITYFVDLLKSLCSLGTIGIGIDLLMLTIFFCMFFILAYLFHKRTILKRI